jgi:hypothetical protein
MQAAAVVMLIDWFVKGGRAAKKVEEIRYLRQMGERATGRLVAKSARQQPRSTAEGGDGKRICLWAEMVAADTYVRKVYISAG